MRILSTVALATILGAAALPAAAAGDAAAGEVKFKQLCAACHGPMGHGDGPAAAGLNPKPRNFADKAWQAKIDDDYLRTVIAKGGPAVGLAPLMTGWGHALNAQQLEDMVAFVRAQGK
jgi:mono/diheme cytochrome c family protein